MEEIGFNIGEHILVPEHVKLTEDEKKKVLEKYNISLIQLPKMFITDPAIEDMELKEGDIIKVIRDSPTSGKSFFYRVVFNG